MQPLYDNLGFIRRRFNIHGAENRLIEEMQKEQKLMISALAYIRGRSLSDVYFIVDEAQNLTPHEVKTIITRAGEGTKMVFTGISIRLIHLIWIRSRTDCRICSIKCRDRIFLPMYIWKRENAVNWLIWRAIFYRK